MDAGLVLQLGRETLWTAVLICLPPLGLAMLVGLIVSILQALTQIQDTTLTFIPKILAVFAALAIWGGWMLNTLTSYATRILGGIGTLGL